MLQQKVCQKRCLNFWFLQECVPPSLQKRNNIAVAYVYLSPRAKILTCTTKLVKSDNCRVSILTLLSRYKRLKFWNLGNAKFRRMKSGMNHTFSYNKNKSFVSTLRIFWKEFLKNSMVSSKEQNFENCLFVHLFAQLRKNFVSKNNGFTISEWKHVHFGKTWVERTGVLQTFKKLTTSLSLKSNRLLQNLKLTVFSWFDSCLYCKNSFCPTWVPNIISCSQISTFQI